MPTPAAHAVAAASCSVGTPASTATTTIASAKPCDSSITASSGWRRLWNPPRKSDSPHESEEPRASSAASTRPRLDEPVAPPWTHVRCRAGRPAGILVTDPRTDVGDEGRGGSRMLSTTADAKGAIRREADQLETSLGRGRFHRRRAFDRSPEAEQLALAAVARARNGDDDALRFLYLRYADNVYGYVCSIVRDEHEAEDVTQQIFAKLMTSLERYEPRLVPFSAWILRVAHNAAIDHVRMRRPVPVEEVRPADTADDDAAGRERFADLRLALAALPAEQRDVIV